MTDFNNRTNCLKTVLYNWHNLSECYKNNWFYKINESQWTIIPYAYESGSSGVVYVSSNGGVSNDDAIQNNKVYSSCYLKSNVQILNDGNNGSKENPYNLSL